jgi:hypothetical protein
MLAAPAHSYPLVFLFVVVAALQPDIIMIVIVTPRGTSLTIGKMQL